MTLALVFLAGIVEAGKWDYGTKHGPKTWGGLCKKGQKQSPINLTRAHKVALPKLWFKYGLRPIKLERSSKGVRLHGLTGEPMGLKVGDREYEFKFMEFHSPSEHQLNGRSFPLEAQLYHQTKGGDWGVLSVFFLPGGKNEFVGTVLAHTPAQAGQTATPQYTQLSPRGVLPEKHFYISYYGSLTKPPCTEGVRWMVFSTPAEASSLQLAQFREILQKNHRPVQPLRDRTLMRN